MADQLATAADLASALQRSFDGYETATAVVWLEAATAVVQAAAGQRIVRATTTETAWGGTGRVLRLKQRPIRSVASVTYGETLLSQGTASGTWRLSPDGLWRDLGWVEVADEPYSSVVVYEAGYDTDEQEIQLGRGTVISLARAPFDNPSGLTSERIDDYAAAFDAAAAALDARPSLKALLRRQYGRKAAMVRVV